MALDKAEFNHMELLNQNLKEMIERIHTEDFLSPENLDEYHREILEKVQKEKENALNEMNAVMAYNPKKVLAKALDDLENALYRIENG